ncbi:sulfurtransferase [Millisia brevis]|uniref:sulfurtransferase n=1 Tax=Millisia brevis TaxID=264148 RepID=UPI0008373664|nr:sulfurtransferase [Millisia brevis]
MSEQNPGVVSVEWLRDHLDDADLVIVDSTTHLQPNPPGSATPYSLEAGRETYTPEHIPGAIFANLLTDFADTDAPQPWTVPSSEKFAASAGAIGIGDGVRVVVYDQHDGYWATRFWWQLRLEGFDNVAILDGGLRAWRAAEAPLTAEIPVPTPRTFTATRRPELLRSTEQVLEATTDADTVLVDVLATEQYNGEATSYARPGHIPGAISLPVFQIRDTETGKLLPVEELRKIFDDAGLLDPAVTPVTYCGGGIAATGVAHALSLVGRSDVGVYDGSLTAWTADADLPLVVGSTPR